MSRTFHAFPFIFTHDYILLRADHQMMEKKLHYFILWLGQWISLKWGREERREKYVDNQHDDEKCNRKRLMRHDKLFLTVTTKCHSRFPSSSLSRLLLKKIIEWNYASVYIKCEWQFVIQSIIFLRLLFFRELRIKNFLEKLLGFEFNN